LRQRRPIVRTSADGLPAATAGGQFARREESVSELDAGTSLEWIISPVSKREFFEQYWEKQPLVVKRSHPDYFGSLLSLEEVDRVITTLDLRYPTITLKNAEQLVTSEDYTLQGDSIDVAKVYQLFEKGSTITLSYLDTKVPTLAAFCRSLESEFSFPFQSNVYLTPARAKGAKYHYDSHDVFVLQVAGSKRWILYGTPVELPLRGQEFDAAVHERGKATLEFHLEAGDFAYIPRGIVHDASSGEATSLHITVGVLHFSWTDVLLESIADVSLNDPAFRKALCPGFARQDFNRAQAREIFSDLLLRLATKSDLDAVLDRFADEFISLCPPLLRGQLGQIINLDRVAMNTVVGSRTGVISQVRTEGEATTVDCYGRKITFPTHVTEALRFALSNVKFVVCELPGDLDDAGKLTLVRRLIREGLLMVLV
jgi:ribosomal protein L16 Arg81 hydroxylase